MEEQYNGDPRDVDVTSDPSNSGTLSSSELTLRFPRPQGNRHLASWISTSEPDMMNPSNPPDDGAEADAVEASYEFINTDDESQDERGTEAESLSSFDYARPDDVNSLDGIERTDDMTSRSDMDSDEDEGNAAEDRSRASSIQYAEESLLNPSSRVATPPLSALAGDNTKKPTKSGQPIEFEEAQGPVYFKQVSVKHATHTFTQEQSAAIARSLNFPEKNIRLIAAVRQTMAQSCLTTKHSLRIMYTGSHAAKTEIMDKISAALVLSSDEHLPEVENCTSAKEIVYQGDQFPGETVYSITIDNEHTYQSAFAPSGSIIEPAWNLPHVAVFYVTEDDDDAARETREAAWGFMQRHAVPCIFISSAELFQHPTENWSDMINQHAIHRCLESSDRAFPSIRLPIDLKSFKELDARQMNRNLVYLTGLYETVDEPRTCENPAIYAQSMKMFRSVRDYAISASEDLDFWTLAQKIGLPLIVATVVLLSNWYLLGGSSASAPAVPSLAPSSSPVLSSPVPASVSTSTVTINLTSTTTIRVPQAKMSQSTAVAPFAELADFIFPESQKPYVCSAEKFSRNQIIVKMPSGTKTSWLAKDSITIDVLKGNKSVKTEFSSTDEGILIAIPKKDARGVLTVAVNTTRKPKVNETFLVDFGKTSLEQCVGFGKTMASQAVGLASNAAQRGAKQALALGSLRNSVLNDMRDVSTRISAEVAHLVKESWKPASLTQNWRDISQSRQAQEAMDWMDMKCKRAQIQSYLWWLKLQQKTQEHDRYLKKAREYLSDRKVSAQKTIRERLERERMESRARRKRERFEARCKSGFSRWTQQCKQQG